MEPTPKSQPELQAGSGSSSGSPCLPRVSSSASHLATETRKAAVQITAIMCIAAGVGLKLCPAGYGIGAIVSIAAPHLIDKAIKLLADLKAFRRDDREGG